MSTVEQAPANGSKPVTSASDLYVRGLTADERVALHHQCQDEAHPDTRQRRPQPRRQRVVGLDVARAVAVIGMMAVHILPIVNPDGRKSWSFLISADNSPALFVLIAGVGIALASGRTVPPTGRSWLAAAVNLVVRALFIGAVGLALGSIVHRTSAAVILPYFAMLFLMAIPILRNPPWLNIGLGLVIAVVGPAASHVLRDTPAVADGVNLTFGDLLAHPGDAFTNLFLTGTYPTISWFAYLCVGMGIGRLRLETRKTAVTLAVTGILLAIAANVGSWYLMDVAGGRSALGAVASRTMPLEEFTDILVWGAGGTLPTTSWWWLAVLAPHTTTPFDLLYTCGIALLVLGACLAAGRVMPGLLGPLATFGSMSLTLYVAHLVMVDTAFFMPEDASAEFLLQVVLLFVFALAWHRRFSKGPLELALSWVGDGAQALLGKRRTA